MTTWTRRGDRWSKKSLFLLKFRGKNVQALRLRSDLFFKKWDSFFQISQSHKKIIPKNYPELEIWISCLQIWAGISNLKLRIVFLIIFWEIGRFEKRISLSENKAPLGSGQKRSKLCPRSHRMPPQLVLSPQYLAQWVDNQILKRKFIFWSICGFFKGDLIS